MSGRVEAHRPERGHRWAGLKCSRIWLAQSERTKRIVANLLDFARQSETKVEGLDIRETIEEITRLVGNPTRIKKVRLIVDVPEEPPTVHGDRQLLGQVFTNLILNALDVLPEKGEIHISFDTERKEGFLAVNVTDNGPGIPGHIMSRIFDPFFTTKPKGKEAGLGTVGLQRDCAQARWVPPR